MKRKMCVDEIVLEVKDLSITIDTVDVVSGINLRLKKGRTLALVGESGCGKSLTALSLMKLLPDVAHISTGSILLGCKELTSMSEKHIRALRGNEISMIFQEPGSTLDPLMPIGKQIIEAIRAHRNISNQEAKIETKRMLEKVGISEPQTRMQQYPFELSGGMCQRIMIATALICKPSVLIADEPTTALDVTIQAQTLDLMRSLKDETGTTILLITHDMGVVADMADEVMIMYAGNVVEHGDVYEIFQEPKHPYTQLLLASIPHLERERKKRLNMIEGIVPDIHHWPQGCRFNPRCPIADTRCKESPPGLEKVNGKNHTVSCWHHQQALSLIDE